MSGVSLEVAKEGPSGNWNEKGQRTFSVPYNVEVSSAADGAQVVMDYMADNNIFPGIPYSCKNDFDNFALCNSISPARIADSTTRWRVTVGYGPAEESERTDESGNFSSDPEDWRWQHEMGYATWQEPVWAAVNLTPFPHTLNAAGHGSDYTRALNINGPVVNSAGVVLDPPLMRDKFDRVWRITTFSRNYDSNLSDTYMGAINEDFLQYHDYLRKYYGFVKLVPEAAPYVVKCTNASATFRVAIINKVRIAYWEWNWEFRFRWALWIESVLDRGLTARAAPGKSDGVGGQIPATPPDGTAPGMAVLDGIGRRVPELVLFDGAGWPIEAGDAMEDDGYFFDWLKDSKQKFKDIPFHFFT